MGKGVAITGMGIISSIGSSVDENFNALMNGKKGISTIDNITTIHKGNIKVGEIKLTNQQLEAMLGIAPDNNFTRTAMLGTLAVKQAIADAGIRSVNEYNTGLISASCVGGMDITEKYYHEYFNDERLIKYIGSHDLGNIAHKIADEIELKGMVTTVSTACSSSANAIALGARLIKAGKLDRAIVGGADALTKFTINGFKTLMILSDTDNSPFDKNRKGLNLGEAAAYLVLESDEVVARENKTPLAYLSGYGNANDAYHQTAASDEGEGAYLAMEKALKVAELAPVDIDYINVHGTATVNNDLTEGRALIRVFGEQHMPDLSSTKPYTGHTLAAAAAIEAVFSILAIRHGVVFPNLNFSTPMEEFRIVPQTTLRHKTVRHVLSNSFGFGGNCSSLIFSRN